MAERGGKEINMIPKNDKLLETARELRRNMTVEEKCLWYRFLRYYPVKIYKQRIIGNYIVDFYCDSAKLVIEIDGYQHFTEKGKAEDKIRDEYMNSLGIEVLRFSNNDIRKKFKGVCSQIDKIIRERMK